MERTLIAFVLASGLLAAVRSLQVRRLGRKFLQVRTSQLNTTIDRKGPNISTER